MGRHRNSFMGSIDGIGTLPLLAVVIIVGLAFIMLFGGAFGFTSDMTNMLFSMLPATFLGVASIYIISQMHSFIFEIGGFIGLGIAIAYLLQQFNVVGIMPDVAFFPYTLQQAQMFTVIIFAFLGAVCGVAMRRRD